jgi:hypothetical protein
MQRRAPSGNMTAARVIVQAERYRYLASSNGVITVRMPISEYLGCEVIWTLD